SSTSATATWKPSIPEPGWYPVWAWYRHSPNRPVDARYEIHHSGGVTEVSISQEVHGKTWRYLGEYYFESGTEGHVTLINGSSDPDQAIIADAVRFGGGMGGVDPGGGISGEPRWEEASIYYAEYQGYPVDLSTNDVIVRPLYAEWEHASGYPGEDAIYVSWHTNCCNYSGTMSFIHNTEPTPGSSSLRSWIHAELIQDLRGAWNPSWLDQGKLSADFGELRELSSMPGVLLEVAYHDTETPGDADDLKEPRFRQIAARAVYQGITRYFSAKDGDPVTLLPEAPTHLIAKNTPLGGVRLSWDAPASGGVVIGDPASYYNVYHSTNGRGFDNGTETNESYLSIEGLQPGTLHFFRVTAINAGGESFPTPVVAVGIPESDEDIPFLLVNGFDRIDKNAMISQEEGGSLGVAKRMFLERMNRYDYAIEHAQALHACNLPFDSALNEAVEAMHISLVDYPALDWFVGEDSIEDEALSGMERSLLATYLDGGGNMLLSGSDIGWDLSSPEHGADPDFYSQYLKTVYAGNDASTYEFAGVGSDILNGLSGSFDDSTHGYYDVDSPDRLVPIDGSRVVLNYNGGSSDGAALAFGGHFRLVYYGFPLETVV
ncbi:MAG: N-acetylmuramoyl-L-alanine amidase, partial [Anaerolineales bacterium]|nr:N-acetylmuramoyl-L-alanine amidase [Anaerolineales bacterium]